MQRMYSVIHIGRNFVIEYNTCLSSILDVKHEETCTGFRHGCISSKFCGALTLLAFAILISTQPERFRWREVIVAVNHRCLLSGMSAISFVLQVHVHVGEARIAGDGSRSSGQGVQGTWKAGE